MCIFVYTSGLIFNFDTVTYFVVLVSKVFGTDFIVAVNELLFVPQLNTEGHSSLWVWMITCVTLPCTSATLRGRSYFLLSLCFKQMNTFNSYLFDTAGNESLVS